MSRSHSGSPGSTAVRASGRSSCWRWIRLGHHGEGAGLAEIGRHLLGVGCAAHLLGQPAACPRGSSARWRAALGLPKPQGCQRDARGRAVFGFSHGVSSLKRGREYPGGPYTRPSVSDVDEQPIAAGQRDENICHVPSRSSPRAKTCGLVSISTPQ